MSIHLTADQEEFIQTKLASGKYQTSEEVISTALHLLDEWEKAQTQWVEEVTSKIDAAVSASEHTPPIDGESFIDEILERLGRAR
ncbi:type II toxin-antitoxin system ParD family antitoxin [Roseofilum reptotaenium CS-1145]|uniref:Transcriptional regulator n=2 Tax=Roseofilum TaxID=1233426 RepID=A0A1L9QL63_9CYAN|nr:type II toxin-antitoxin system ParD family antitoxin [Roseofilum reptotaenium CS-1145]OJJ18941.1 transcriptional regulator [Roseofilum reptotaenium AO1-A]